MSFMDIQQYDCLGLFLKVGILYVLTELAGVHNGIRGTCIGDGRGSINQTTLGTTGKYYQELHTPIHITHTPVVTEKE